MSFLAFRVGRPEGTKLARRPAADRARVAGSPSDAVDTSPSKARIRGVEGFRALAASSIILYHTWLYSSPGGPVALGPFTRFVAPHLPVGVTMFFTLSGFLLYRPMVSCVLNSRPLPAVGSYLRNRALRILPVYWVILIATAVVLPAVTVRLSASDVELGRLVSHPSALLSNAVLMQNYFAGSLDTGIGPAWSLAVEVVFYLTLPFLAVFAAALAVPAASRRGRTTAALVPPFVLFGVGLVSASAASSILAPDGLWHSILVRSFLYHADLFAFGMALAVLMVSIEDGVVALPPWWRKAAFVSLVITTLTTLVLVDRGALLTYRGAVPYETLTAIASVLLLGLVVLPSADASVSHLTRLLDTRVLVAIGLASYSMFLWHEPLIRWLQSEGLTFTGRIGLVENLALVCTLTAVLATLTYRFVERPALAQKRR